MIEKTQKVTKKDKEAGQYAEIVLSPGFRKVNNQAFEAADDDGEVYAAWRGNLDKHLGQIASIVVGNKLLDERFWELQRDVALDLLDGNALGPFADIPFKLTVQGRAVSVEPETGEPMLAPGEIDVVATNNRISGISRDIDDPLEFLDTASQYVQSRRRKAGSKFEGPENYATMLKFFTDKTFDEPLTEGKDKTVAKKLVNEAIGNFLRVADRDEPNIIEITNILSSVKNLPPDTIDKRFTSGILKNTLALLDQFSQKGINLFISALAKLDVEACSEPAAMTLDLALRKGAKFERSGDLLSGLRAVAHMPHSSASERAFTTLLDVRNALEVSSNIHDLQETNKLLRVIVQNVTESPEDTLRAKKVADYSARRAVGLYKDIVQSSTTDHENLRKAVEAIIKDARAM